MAPIGRAKELAKEVGEGEAWDWNMGRREGKEREDWRGAVGLLGGALAGGGAATAGAGGGLGVSAFCWNLGGMSVAEAPYCGVLGGAVSPEGRRFLGGSRGLIVWTEFLLEPLSDLEQGVRRRAGRQRRHGRQGRQRRARNSHRRGASGVKTVPVPFLGADSDPALLQLCADTAGQGGRAGCPLHGPGAGRLLHMSTVRQSNMSVRQSNMSTGRQSNMSTVRQSNMFTNTQ